MDFEHLSQIIREFKTIPSLNMSDQPKRVMDFEHLSEIIKEFKKIL